MYSGELEVQAKRKAIAVLQDEINRILNAGRSLSTLPELIVKKDKNDKIIEGSPDKIKFVSDIWKFTKNIKNSSPNWYLAEIVSQ